MRTTVTLDPDAESAIRQVMRSTGVSFKRALNDAIRLGTARSVPGAGTVTRVRRLGDPAVDLDEALRLAADLEDHELAHRLREGR